MENFKSPLVTGFISLCLVSGVWAYSGGNGTTDPYQIDNVDDWQQLMETPSDWDKSFIMTADIDLVGINLTPVGNTTTKFAGVFDGNDHVIRNAAFNQHNTDYIGLFGSIEGKVQNLGIEDVNIIGRNYIGGLAGSNAGTITSCYATGSVNGLLQTGGLVGFHFGTLTACYTACSVTGTGALGGLVGMSFGSITSCFTLSSVSGTDRIGGLVGYNVSTVRYCYSTGLVNGSTNTGGLIGYGIGDVISCFWDMETSEIRTSAGGTGKTTAQMKTLSTFTSAGWDFLDESTNGTEDTWKARPDNGDYPMLTWQSDIDLIGWQETDQDEYFFNIYDANTQTLLAEDDWGCIEWGQQIQIKYTIKNKGLDEAGPFHVNFYLSKDAIIGNSDDIKLGNAYWSDGLAGESYLVQTSPVLKMPANCPSTDFGRSMVYFGMKIDPNNSVAESNEVNNYNTGVGTDKRTLVMDIFNLSGYVKGNSGAPLAGVTVTAGNNGGTTKTNASGYYVLLVPRNWTGKVIPSKSGFMFSPTSRSYSVFTETKSQQNFTAYAKPTISGYLKTSGGSPLSGVTITASNGGLTTTTSPTGYYALKVPYNWTGKVTPTKSGYSFAPGYLSYTGLKAGKSSQNFIAYVRPTVAGYVKTSSEMAISGITITASNGGPTTTTSSTGYYTLKVPYNWTGKITPTKTGYSFAPSSLSYTSVKAGKCSQNFTAYLRPIISGYVKTSDGRPLAGVAIISTFGGGTTTTNASGYYELAVPYEWAGIIKPGKTGLSFKPKCLAYPPVTHSKTSKNYTARY